MAVKQIPVPPVPSQPPPRPNPKGPKIVRGK
jgi:hypothetical protein